MLNLTEVRVKINGGGGFGISKYPLISVMNEKRDKCLILMLNLNVSKKKHEGKLVRTR